MTNTATFTVVSVLGHLLIGLGVALLLNQEIRGRAAFRNLALLPWMLPPAVVATGWAWLYHNPFGMLNPLLDRARPPVDAPGLARVARHAPWAR